jgi:hypothetical protein
MITESLLRAPAAGPDVTAWHAGNIMRIGSQKRRSGGDFRSEFKDVDDSPEGGVTGGDGAAILDWGRARKAFHDRVGC